VLTRLAVLLLAAAAPLAAQQPRAFVRHAAPGAAGDAVASVLAQPYTIRHEQWNTRLFRGTVIDSSVVVPGSDATVAGTVHGDVLVVGGNLFLWPGAKIDGRAIAIGGRVYDTRAAVVNGTKLSFPSVHIQVDSTADGYTLDYRPPAAPEETALLSLPAVFGIRVPSYDRVDGLSAVWGPHLSLIHDRVQLDPIATYRSDLGAIDGFTTVDGRLNDDWSITGYAGRSTLTNDAWIQTALVNSLAVLVVGHDYRNYWRADRFQGLLVRSYFSESGQTSVSLGARTERDWSVRAGGAWSVSGYGSANGILRINPAIEHGRLSSALGSATATYTFGQMKFDGSLLVERSFDTPVDEQFTQTTFDATLSLPTFGRQSIWLHTHDVLTAGDTAPAQRFAYLGGAGTLPTFDLLTLGGDHLVYLNVAYTIPITALKIKFVGSPTLALHEALGSAGIGGLPRFEQNIGARLGFPFFWAGIDFDPRSHRDAFSIGLNVPGLP
jgi:hypothetical protein